MTGLGGKIALKRKDAGLTQEEFAEKMAVTRQTVSRWEAGTVLPDIDKIPDIAKILGVSCDYLLNDSAEEEPAGRQAAKGVSRLLAQLQGKLVKLSFFEDELDIDLFNTSCRVLDFEGNWVRVEAELKKGRVEKLIPLASVRALEIVKEAE